MISLADLTITRLEEGDRTQNLWKMLAFLGRYGHQDIQGWLKAPITDLYRAVKALSVILEEEAAANRRAAGQE